MYIATKLLIMYFKESTVSTNLVKAGKLDIYSFYVEHSSNVSATPIGQKGLEMGWLPLGNV